MDLETAESWIERLNVAIKRTYENPGNKDAELYSWTSVDDVRKQMHYVDYNDLGEKLLQAKKEFDWPMVSQVKNELEKILDNNLPNSSEDEDDEDEDEDDNIIEHEDEDESSEDSVHGFGKYDASIKRISAQDVKDDRDSEDDENIRRPAYSSSSEDEEQKEIKREEEQRAAVFEMFERKRRRLMNRVKYEVYKEKKKKKLKARTEAKQPNEIIKKLQNIRMGEISKTSEVPPAIPPPPPSRVGSSNSTWTWTRSATSPSLLDIDVTGMDSIICGNNTGNNGISGMESTIGCNSGSDCLDLIDLH